MRNVNVENIIAIIVTTMSSSMKKRLYLKPYSYSKGLQYWSGYIDPEGYFYKVVNRKNDLDFVVTHASWAKEFVSSKQEILEEYKNSAYDQEFYFLVSEKHFVPYEYGDYLNPPNDLFLEEGYLEYHELSEQQLDMIEKIRRLNGKQMINDKNKVKTLKV